MNIHPVLAYLNPELIATLFFIILIGVVYKHSWHHFHKKSLKTKSLVDTSLLEALNWPFYVLLIVLAVQSIIPYLPDWFFEKISHTPKDFSLLFSGAFIFFTLLVFNRFLSNVQATITRIEKNEVLPNAKAWVSACKLGRLISILIFDIYIICLQ